MAEQVVGRINNILPQSFVDGPGNRSVIFLQGCQFTCLYCHNPYTINICNACGICVESCPVGALSLEEGEVLWDSAKCVNCDTCVEICPNSSSPKIHFQTPEETWEILRAYIPFISGVTVSGGEPICQPEYLADLLALIKSQSDLTTCIETNGGVGLEEIEPLLPNLDYVMVDLKAYDPESHLALTGQDNARTLELIRAVSAAGKLHMVRTVIAPGFTDDDAQIAEIARFLAGLDPEIHFRLLRFRSHGTRGIATTWESPTDAAMDHLVEIAKAAGLVNVDRSL